MTKYFESNYCQKLIPDLGEFWVTYGKLNLQKIQEDSKNRTYDKLWSNLVTLCAKHRNLCYRLFVLESVLL
jgi:hypothetical protein